MDKPWFDPGTNSLRLEEYVSELDSYKKIVSDEVVTGAELEEQTQRVIKLMQHLEELLTPEAKAVATDMLCELAVLYVLQARSQDLV